MTDAGWAPELDGRLPAARWLCHQTQELVGGERQHAEHAVAHHLRGATDPDMAATEHLEVTGRRERRIQRRIHEARFPMLKTLDAFSFEAQPELDRDAVLQVFDCSFVTEAANVVYVGGVDPAS